MDVAVADDRHGHGGSHGRDHLPIGAPRVALGPGPPMDGDTADARPLEETRGRDGVDGALIPADADFGGDRERGAGFHDGRRDPLQQGAVAQER